MLNQAEKQQLDADIEKKKLLEEKEKADEKLQAAQKQLEAS
jgi:hypothetical protein